MRLLSTGVGISMVPRPDSTDGMIGRLQAIDVANQRLAWTVNQIYPITSGLLATAGGLVFSGDLEPSLKAFDDGNGELLWEAALDDAPNTSIMAYSVDDRQFVAMVVGMRNFHVDGLRSIFRGRAPKKTCRRRLEEEPRFGPSRSSNSDSQFSIQSGIHQMKSNLIVVALLSVICTAVAKGQDAQGSRPNVLFIAVDDLNDWVGCLG